MEVLRIPDDVLLHLVEVGGDTRHRVVLLPQVGELHADRVFGNLLVERFDALAVRLAELRHHFDAFLQVFAQALDCRFDLLALFFR